MLIRILTAMLLCVIYLPALTVVQIPWLSGTEVVALYKFPGNSPDDLPFRRGEILTIVHGCLVRVSMMVVAQQSAVIFTLHVSCQLFVSDCKLKCHRTGSLFSSWYFDVCISSGVGNLLSHMYLRLRALH